MELHVNRGFTIITQQKYSIAASIVKHAALSLVCSLQPTVTLADEIWLPASETDCRVEGWSKDIKRNGLKVYSSPTTHAEVLGVLPAYVQNFSSHNFGIEFQIIGSHNGWIKITGAKDDPNRSNLSLRPTYSGTGWIPGSSVDFIIQSGIGYLHPDTKSTKVLDLQGDWLTSMGNIELVVACDGEWVLLDYSLKKRRNLQTLALRELSPKEQNASQGRAWFRGVCANQETTCETDE
ncbi:MAG: SH3 domain-containing protein [Candidatus Thiodiazotropha sp. LLP2]